jgi:lysyl-tRNA synthetase class 2
MLQKRSQIVARLRRALAERGFMEAQTPILQPIYGGANARPFTTHHNALDMTLYMRIAPELYLKRLLVGGFERVYEIGPCFRNEGVDARHNPEFFMLEAYQAYGDFEDMMDPMDGLVVELADEVCGGTTFTYRDHEIDVTPPFERVNLLDAVREAHGHATRHVLDERRVVQDEPIPELSPAGPLVLGPQPVDVGGFERGHVIMLEGGSRRRRAGAAPC